MEDKKPPAGSEFTQDEIHQYVPDEIFLTDNQVADRYVLHRITIWKRVREGRFPPPIRMDGITRWRLSDLQKWEAEKVKASA